mgnify:CR=1 FL=1
MKFIKLKYWDFGEDIIINVDQIAYIKTEGEYTLIRIKNSDIEILVIEDIDEVMRRIHLQTIKWEDGQFFINGEPQKIKGE